MALRSHHQPLAVLEKVIRKRKGIRRKKFD
jgi:hypothetical protein